MTIDNLHSIIDYIVEQSILAIQNNTKEHDLKLDLVDIFTKDEQEYADLLKLLNTLGKIVKKTKTGNIYLLNKPLGTTSGKLQFIKIRIPDKNKPYRGAPDFKVKNYDDFKKQYLESSKFNLIVRPEYEMLELMDKDFDVLVYFPNITFSEENKV